MYFLFKCCMGLPLIRSFSMVDERKNDYSRAVDFLAVEACGCVLSRMEAKSCSGRVLRGVSCDHG